MNNYKMIPPSNLCVMHEYGTDNYYLMEYPKGNKFKWMGKWFFFQDKFFAGTPLRCTITFSSKDNYSLIFRNIVEGDTIEFFRY